MRFDVVQLKKCFEDYDANELIALGYCYLSNTTYISEEEYADLVVLMNTILDVIYDVNNRDVQAVFFEVIRNVVNIHLCSISDLETCLDKIGQRIRSGKLDNWELAESLLILSCSFESKYIELMNVYKNYHDDYVQSVVQEYFFDLQNKRE